MLSFMLILRLRSTVSLAAILTSNFDYRDLRLL
jgi:hypothetical protein